MEALFSQLDLDSDGFITAENLLYVLGESEEANSQAHDIVQTLGSNGRISLEEFVQGFAAVMEDQPENVTREEILEVEAMDGLKTRMSIANLVKSLQKSPNSFDSTEFDFSEATTPKKTTNSYFKSHSFTSPPFLAPPATILASRRSIAPQDIGSDHEMLQMKYVVPSGPINVPVNDDDNPRRQIQVYQSEEPWFIDRKSIRGGSSRNNESKRRSLLSNVVFQPLTDETKKDEEYADITNSNRKNVYQNRISELELSLNKLNLQYAEKQEDAEKLKLRLEHTLDQLSRTEIRMKQYKSQVTELETNVEELNVKLSISESRCDFLEASLTKSNQQSSLLNQKLTDMEKSNVKLSSIVNQTPRTPIVPKSHSASVDYGSSRRLTGISNYDLADDLEPGTDLNRSKVSSPPSVYRQTPLSRRVEILSQENSELRSNLNDLRSLTDRVETLQKDKEALQALVVTLQNSANTTVSTANPSKSASPVSFLNEELFDSGYVSSHQKILTPTASFPRKVSIVSNSDVCKKDGDIHTQLVHAQSTLLSLRRQINDPEFGTMLSVFSRLDKCSSGFINAQKLCYLVNLVMAPRSENIADILSIMDPDHMDEINFSQFVLALSTVRGIGSEVGQQILIELDEWTTEQFRRDFDAQDIDRTGIIDRDQAVYILFDPPSVIKRKLLKLFGIRDNLSSGVSCNSQISREEFLNTYFSKIRDELCFNLETIYLLFEKWNHEE